MNVELKEALRALVEAVELDGQIKKVSSLMSGAQKDAEKASWDLVEQARTDLAKVLLDTGYPSREWPEGKLHQGHIVNGDEGTFAGHMANAARERKSQLHFTFESTVYRAFPPSPGDWEGLLVIKAPYNTGNAPGFTTLHIGKPTRSRAMSVPNPASQRGSEGM